MALRIIKFLVIILIFLFFSIIILVVILRDKPIEIRAKIIRSIHAENKFNQYPRHFFIRPGSSIQRAENFVPWGISKFESKILQIRPVVEETHNRLVFGSYIYDGYAMDSIYYEYYFNKNGRLFKITETSGLKYVHVEENPKLAEYYLNIPKGEEYEEHYGLYNTISMTKLDGFIDALGIITWRDSNGVEKTAQFSPWMSYNEIYQLTEIDLYEDKVNKIIDNDIKILRTDEMFGHNVVFHQEIREVGDGVVLGETSLTNILLKD